MDVERLRLIDKGRSAKSQVDNFLLTDFPHSLEDVSSLFGDLRQRLHRSIRSYQFLPQLRIPQILHIEIDTFEIRYSTRFLLTQTNYPARTLLVYRLAVNGSKV